MDVEKTRTWEVDIEEETIQNADPYLSEQREHFTLNFSPSIKGGIELDQT